MTETTIRLLSRSDASALEGFYYRLDQAARVARFWKDVRHEDIKNYTHTLPYHERIVCGSFCARTLRGIAEAQAHEWPHERHWEIVLSVERPWQQQGLARGLLEATLSEIEERGGREAGLYSEGDAEALAALLSGYDSRIIKRGRGHIAFIRLGDERARHPLIGTPVAWIDTEHAPFVAHDADLRH